MSNYMELHEISSLTCALGNSLVNMDMKLPNF